MIAGAWHPSDPEAVRALLRRLGTASAAIASGCGGGVVGVAAEAPSRTRGPRHAFRGDVCGLADGVLDRAGAARLRGAFALISASPEGLLLARGVNGGRPLFVRRLAGGMVVACSSLGRLAALAHSRLDVDGVCAALVGGPPAAPRATLHAGIERVLGGEVVIFGAGGERRAKLAIPALPTRLRRIRPDDAADELWRLLRASVARVIAGHQRVAVFASGGLDSSGVLAAAVAAANGAKVVPITLVGDDRDLRHLRALCAWFGLTPMERRSEEVSGVSVAPVVEGYPFGDLGAATVIREALRTARAGVALCGQFGDDLLGETALQALHADATLLRAIWLAARTEVPWQPRAFDRIKRWVAYPRLSAMVPRALLEHRRAARAYVPPWAGPELARRIADGGRVAAQVRVGATPEARYRAFAFADAWCSVAEIQGRLEDFTAVELHDPLQDDALLAFIASLPAPRLLDGSLYRGLYRRALRGRIPETLRMRRDKSPAEPGLVRTFVAGGGFAAIRELATFDALAELGVVDSRVLGVEVDRLRAAPLAPEAARLWAYLPTLLSLEAFLREPGAHTQAPIVAEAS